MTVDVDVTKLVKFAEEQGQRFSPTAAVVKAVGHLVVKRPRLNRGLFYTLFGPRIVEFETVRVNLPVMIANQGKPVLSGMVVEDPAEKTVDAIHQEIRNFSAGDVSN